MQEAHDPYAVLRIRDYRLFLAGGILSSIGSEIQAATVLWEIYVRTGSKAAIGYAGLVMFLPVLLFSLAAGHTADRFSRKWQFLIAQAVMMLGSLGLALVSFFEGPIPLIYLCLFFSGMSRAFSAPARSSMLPQIIPMSMIGNAVTWSSSGFHIANVGGPALFGLAYVWFNHEAAPVYMLACTCSWLCMILFFFIQPRPIAKPTEAPTLASLFDGVKFVWRTKLLLAAITLDLFAVLLGGATALLPVFAKDILHEGAESAGYLRAAPAVGALTMGLIIAHWPLIQRRSGPALLLAVAGFGAATIGFGLSTNFWLSLVMLALTGALDNISVVIRTTLVQTITPDNMRGRVSAVNLVFISSSNELGAFESGITAEWFGAVESVVGGGIGTIGVVLMSMLLWPQLMTLGSLHAKVPTKESEPVIDYEEEEGRPIP
jgi:MFS family permease